MFNVTGPAEPLTFAGMLDGMRAALPSDARLTWVDEAFLLEHEVHAWTEMPVWVPSSATGFLQADISRALDAGLTFRSLEETVRDTRAWDLATPESERPEKTGLRFDVGISTEREPTLLAAWRERRMARSLRRKGRAYTSGIHSDPRNQQAARSSSIQSRSLR